MCRSQEQGGRRCSSHLQQAITRRETTITTNQGKWTAEELRQAQAEVNAWRAQLNRQRDAYNARKRNAALRDQKRRQERLNQLTSERTPPTSETATYKLTAAEHDLIAQQAREAGITKSEWVRTRLTEPPTVEASLVEDLDETTWLTRADSQGRNPSVTSTVRTGDKVRLPQSLRAHIETQAATYALTSSDYMRAVLTGQDPRLPFGHMSEETRRARREHFKQLEAGQTAATVQEFYETRFRGSRGDEHEEEQPLAA